MDLIVEEKAKQIADAWGEAVVNQLRPRVPRASGALASAMLKRTPPQRVGHGWVVGIGDMELIGAGPFDSPPRNTISAFLEMWYQEAGGSQEISDRKTVKEDRLKAREEKIKRRADEIEAARKDREWWDKSREREDTARRSIREAERDKDLREERDKITGYPEERVAAWRLRRQEREDVIELIERFGDPGRMQTVEGREVWVETYRMRRLREQHAMALAREQKWAARAQARQRKISALEARIKMMQRRIDVELERRRKRLLGKRG